jgi:hypothetical protein
MDIQVLAIEAVSVVYFPIHVVYVDYKCWFFAWESDCIKLILLAYTFYLWNLTLVNIAAFTFEFAFDGIPFKYFKGTYVWASQDHSFFPVFKFSLDFVYFKTIYLSLSWLAFVP